MNNKQGISFGLLFSGLMCITKGVISFGLPDGFNLAKLLILVSLGLVLCGAGYWLKRKYNLTNKG